MYQVFQINKDSERERDFPMLLDKICPSLTKNVTTEGVTAFLFLLQSPQGMQRHFLGI
jgi:hypothetical protein